MSAKAANTAEFQDAGIPLAIPSYSVDFMGAPIPYSLSGTQVQSTAVAANTLLAATLTPSAGQTMFIVGFIFTAHVTTVNTAQVITITGCIGGTMNYQVGFNTTVPINLPINFGIPIPATGPGVGIAFSSAAGTNVPAQAVVLYGFSR